MHPYFLKEEEYALAHYFGSSIGRNLAGYERADLDHKLLEHKEIVKALKGFDRSSRNG